MKTLQFIATAHNEEIHNCVFVDSMLNQTHKNFSAHVWHNGYNVHMDTWIQDMNNGLYEDGKGCIVFKHSDTDTGNWGTANRQQAIMECTADYIIQTSVQDYFLPQAVEYILKSLESSPDLVLWNSINHLVAPCQVLDSQLAWSKLDWGNFAIRTDIAKKVGIRHGDQYCADWLFIKDVLDSGLLDKTKVIKINAILTIHS